MVMVAGRWTGSIAGRRRGRDGALGARLPRGTGTGAAIGRDGAV
jgi:hypothetical protein